MLIRLIDCIEQYGYTNQLRQNDIQQKYNESPIKKWIKIIPFDKTIPFILYNRKNFFKYLSDIVLDTSKRQTLIQLNEYTNEIQDKNTEWVYIIVIDGRIVKIGGTRDGIKGRFGSYLLLLRNEINQVIVPKQMDIYYFI